MTHNLCLTPAEMALFAAMTDATSWAARPAGDPAGRRAFWMALCWAAMLLALVEITGLA